MLVAAFAYLDGIGKDVPAACIDQNPANAAVIRAHERVTALGPDEEKVFTRAIEDMWHGATATNTTNTNTAVDCCALQWTGPC